MGCVFANAPLILISPPVIALRAALQHQTAYKKSPHGVCRAAIFSMLQTKGTSLTRNASFACLNRVLQEIVHIR